jgi:hypothetical protein
LVDALDFGVATEVEAVRGPTAAALASAIKPAGVAILTPEVGCRAALDDLRESLAPGAVRGPGGTRDL